jgi:formyl-CoA transferase
MTTDNASTADNILSGLKVVDFASFVAGPGAAVILSDFGADVIKVEPPKGELWRLGHKLETEPFSDVPYPWHLNNRNKRGLALDLKSPDAGKILERLAKWADVFIVNTPHPAREKLGLTYEEVSRWNPRLVYADLTGYGDNGPDAHLPGFDITAYWSRSGLLSLMHDAGAPPTWPFSGTGDGPTGVVLFSAILLGLYRRERTGKGSAVTTSLLAAGVWAAGIAVQAALSGAKFRPQHDQKNPATAFANVYQSSDDVWFLTTITPDRVPAFLAGIERPDLLKDPRFADPAKTAANMSQLTAIFAETLRAKPIAHWQQVLDKAHITYGVVRDPREVIKDPQLQANNIVVPLEGAGDTMKLTIGSPIQMRGVTKVSAKRAPGLGEHNEQILQELGFDANEIQRLSSAGVIARHTASAKAA